MLSRCTTISMSSGGRSYSHIASISSSPLFIMVAESMVILAPIDQFGCASACSRVMPRISSNFFPKNGPPEAVSRIFETGFPFAACTH